MTQPRYHVSGLGGVGMSALAQLLLDRGAQVQGSDRFRDQGVRLPVMQRLEAGGVRVVPQDGITVTPDLDAVVISTAVEADNPERLAAERAGVPVRHRAEVLADQLRGDAVCAVAGTAGKTTTTGLLGWLLAGTGHDPRVVNGGAVPAWNAPDRVGSVRARTGADAAGLAVVEVDESDRSLLRFTPRWALITNVSRDHFALEETWALFREFAGQVEERLFAPEDVARDLGAVGTTVEPIHFEVECGARDSQVTWKGESYRCPLPGRHNAENAGLALAVARSLGASADDLREALMTFPGIERRLERHPSSKWAAVFDDYAHNPAKIRAAWTTARGFGERVVGLWRPHGFGPLAAMEEDLLQVWSTMLQPDDRLWILPVYYAGGTAGAQRDSEHLVKQLQDVGVRAERVEDLDAAAEALAAEAASDAVALVMGARDPGLPGLAQRLAAG